MKNTWTGHVAKTSVKKATGVDTSHLTKAPDLGSLKLDVNSLKSRETDFDLLQQMLKIC